MASPDKWQKIGWDGLTLELPAEWEPRVIRQSYLLFAHQDKPALELKWQPGSGTFDAARVRKRLQRSLGREILLEDWQLPPELQSCLPGLQASGFRLPREQSLTYGMLLFCAECRRTSLVRFSVNPVEAPETIRRILVSLRDHPADENVLWALYDIRSLLPREADLQSCEFLPGRFTLRFALKGMTMTLYRWKPAAAILKNSSLHEFAVNQGFQGEAVADGENRVRCNEQASGLNLLRARLRRKPAGLWFDLRHMEEHNAILGVRGEGKTRNRESLLKDVSRNFTVTASK